MKTAQAWVEIPSGDPEAISARTVARARLAEGADLAEVRRMRLFELAGSLPARAELESLLHRSTWFYNPHKERCTLRLAAQDPVPLSAGEIAVLVLERGGERRAAAERWWRHETGEEATIREAVIWVLRYERPEGAEQRARTLAALRGPGQGLLCNPNSQAFALGEGHIPCDWIRRTVEADHEEGGGA